MSGGNERGSEGNGKISWSIKVFMIKAIGIDIIKIERLKRALQRWGTRLERRIFTSKEIDVSYGKTRATYLAGRFAAKEAVFKSLGTGGYWRDIEVLSGKNNQPYIVLQRKMKRIADLKGVKKILISLSHDHDYAIAQAIAIGEGR
jgi:phosphopantetheine--protein transferase-like protein